MYKYMPIKYHIFNENDNMIFGESVTEVSIDDEAAGPFIVLTQEDNKVKLDFDEIPVLFELLTKIIKECDKIEELEKEKFGRGV